MYVEIRLLMIQPKYLNVLIYSVFACLHPPIPTAESQLSMVWDSNPVNISEFVPYECQRGMRLASELSKTPDSIECLPDNAWDEPAQWEQCVESK